MSALGPLISSVLRGESAAVARAISLIGAGGPPAAELQSALEAASRGAHRIGITGPPGVGKSTLIGGLIGLLRARGERVAVVACDPASPVTGGAFLGDRMRMGGPSGVDPGVFIRSIASRGPGAEIPPAALGAAEVLAAAGYRRVIFETAGAGQNDTGLRDHVDTVVVVLSPEAGDEYQVMKAGLIETADILVVNRADRSGSSLLARLLEEEVTSRRSGPRAVVLRTVATRGEGLPELLEAIEARRGLALEKMR